MTVKFCVCGHKKTHHRPCARPCICTRERCPCVRYKMDRVQDYFIPHWTKVCDQCKKIMAKNKPHTCKQWRIPFLERMAKLITVVGDCHELQTAKKSKYPFVYFSLKLKCVQANRAMWLAHHGEIPKGFFVCHSCDNPKCINIKHLWLGTPKENTRDAMAKGRLARVGRRWVKTIDLLEKKK